MSPRPHRCRLARSVVPYADGELAAADAFSFEDHLPGCATCREALEAQRRLEESLLALPTPRLLIPDRARLRAGISDRIDHANSIPPRRVAPALARVASIGALATAAALILWLASGGSARSGADSGERESTPSVEPTAGVADGTAAGSLAAFDGVTPPYALLAIARDFVADVMRRLPARYVAVSTDDPLTRFLAGVEPLRAAGVSVTPVLVEILRDPDPALAERAADLLARAARAGALGRHESHVVARLADAMRRPDRGTALLNALVAIDTPRAREAVASALALENVRRSAARALARIADAERIEALAEALIAMAADPADRDLALELAASLPIAGPHHVRLLAALARAGLPDAVLAAAIARAREPAAAHLEAALEDRDERLGRDARLLAPLSGAERLIAPLARRAAQRRGGEPALSALARFRGEAALIALAELAADESLPRTREPALAEAFESILAGSEPGGAALAALLAARPDLAPIAVELTIAAGGPAGAAARAAALATAELDDRLRASLARTIVARGESIEADLLLEIVAALAAGEAAEAARAGLTGPILVLLYRAGGEEALFAGVDELGVPLSRRARSGLRDATRRLALGSGRSSDLDRIEDLLSLAP